MAPEKQEQILDVCGGFNLRRIGRAFTQFYDQALSPCGLRSTQSCILMAAGTKKDMPMTEIANRLDLSLSTLSRNIQPLIKQGYLTAVSSGSRTKIINITPKGEEKIEEFAPLWEQAQEQFIEAMGENDWMCTKDKLDDALDQVRQAS